MSKVDDVLAVASSQLGKPYSYGDEGPNSFDCSGLVQWVYSHVGISLPRTAAQQQAATTGVTSPNPGDLVFWGTPAYHVAIYIGNGKIIAAPHSGAKVQVQPMWGQPSKYGRVAGLGAAIAPAIALAGAGFSTVGSLTSDFLGGARAIVVEGLFVILGVGLVGYGLYRGVVAPNRKRIDNAIEGALS
jgi:hypothetical protein